MKHHRVVLTAWLSVWCLPDVGPRGAQLTAATSQRVHLVPVDQASQDPQFASFRARLIAAVRSRDAAFVIAASMPDLQKRGYMHDADVRGPAETRAYFTKQDGRWRLTGFYGGID